MLSSFLDNEYDFQPLIFRNRESLYMLKFVTTYFVAKIHMIGDTELESFIKYN